MRLADGVAGGVEYLLVADGGRGRSIMPAPSWLPTQPPTAITMFFLPPSSLASRMRPSSEKTFS